MISIITFYFYNLSTIKHKFKCFKVVQILKKHYYIKPQTATTLAKTKKNLYVFLQQYSLKKKKLKHETQDQREAYFTLDIHAGGSQRPCKHKLLDRVSTKAHANPLLPVAPMVRYAQDFRSQKSIRVGVSSLKIKKRTSKFQSNLFFVVNLFDNLCMI